MNNLQHHGLEGVREKPVRFSATKAGTILKKDVASRYSELNERG